MLKAANDERKNHGRKLANGLCFRLLCFLLCCCLTAARAQNYTIEIHPVDKNAGDYRELVALPERPLESASAMTFIQGLVPHLQEKGYLAASIDSVAASGATYHVFLYYGSLYRWAEVGMDGIDNSVLLQAGVKKETWTGRPLNARQLSAVTDKLLTWGENNGYPFARIWLEMEREMDTQGLRGSFRMVLGPAVRLDSVIITGDLKVSRGYLLRYLDLRQGEPYNEKKLGGLSARLNELPFLQEAAPWTVRFDPGRTSLTIYVKERKANQLNGIVGLLPNSVETGKFLLTVDALFAFRNLLGRGEGISMTYQNLQYKSPRLKAELVYPYLLNTPIGIDFQFDLFKKDTSFRRTSLQAGVRYQMNAQDYFRVFYRNQSNRLITVDTAYVRASHQLPDDVDLSAHGAGAEAGMNHTDYRPNPRRGWEARISSSALLRHVRKTDAITSLEDPAGFDYGSLYDTVTAKNSQYQLYTDIAAYLPLRKNIVVQSAYHGGWISGTRLFRNELHQLGGFRLLRGFDEQSLYASEYHIVTLELRVILDRNSWFYLFSDNGLVTQPLAALAGRQLFHGFGAGTTLETASGLFSLAYGLGTGPGYPLQLRQSRVHFGYVTYF